MPGRSDRDAVRGAQDPDRARRRAKQARDHGTTNAPDERERRSPLTITACRSIKRVCHQRSPAEQLVILMASPESCQGSRSVDRDEARHHAWPLLHQASTRSRRTSPSLSVSIGLLKSVSRLVSPRTGGLGAYNREMRQHLVKLAPAFLVGGRSLIYNRKTSSPPADASIDMRPPNHMEIVADADPTMLGSTPCIRTMSPKASAPAGAVPRSSSSTAHNFALGCDRDADADGDGET